MEVLIVLSIIFFAAEVLGVISTIITIIGKWALFKKLGRKSWHSLIPFLTTYDLYEPTWGKMPALASAATFLIFSILAASIMETPNDIPDWLHDLTYLLSVFTLIFHCRGMANLAKSFGKGVGFTIGLIFFKPIFICILGYGKAMYLGTKGVGGFNPYGNQFNAPYGDPYGGMNMNGNQYGMNMSNGFGGAAGYPQQGYGMGYPGSDVKNEYEIYNGAPQQTTPFGNGDNPAPGFNPFENNNQNGF